MVKSPTPKLANTNYEIVLISESAEDARWIINALKRTKFTNELIWIKDQDRALDYLSGSGLYAGREPKKSKLVFVLDAKFPGIGDVKQQLEHNTDNSTVQILSLAEIKHDLDVNNRDSTAKFFLRLFSTLQAMVYSFF